MQNWNRGNVKVQIDIPDSYKRITDNIIKVFDKLYNNKLFEKNYNRLYVTKSIEHGNNFTIDLGARDNLYLLYRLWQYLPSYGYSVFIADRSGGTGLHIHLQDDNRGRRGVETKVNEKDTWIYDFNDNYIADIYNVNKSLNDDKSLFESNFVFILLIIVLLFGISK